MTRRERLQFLFTWVCLGLLPLFVRPLWEPDEGRYAEIPREMIARADWLTPTLNWVHYFEKPAFQYWLGAASLKAFGVNAVAARLPLALASAISMAAAFLLARRLGARRPMWAAFMAASAILGFVCGQILTLDALFSAFMVLSLALVIEAVWARMEGRPSLGWTLGAFAAIALALLTKGLAAPVLVGGAFLASLPWAWREARLRRALLGILFNPWGWLLFVGLSAPWFVAVDRANPGHAHFFFVREHFQRFSSHVHARQGSNNWFLDKLYFVPVLLLGLVPWLSAAVTGFRRALGFMRSRGLQGEAAALTRWTVSALVMGILVPFAFFSLSGSKLPTYILPVLVPAVALACALEREGEENRSFFRMGVELVALGAALALVAPFLLMESGGLPWVLVQGLLFLMLGFWAMRPKGLTGNRWMASLSAVLLLLSFSAQAVAGRGKSVTHLVRQAPANAQWLSVGYYFQGIAFQTGQRVTVVMGTGELEYGRDQLSTDEQARWFPTHLEDLDGAVARMRQEHPDRPVWALFDSDAWPQMKPEARGRWEVVDRTKAAYLARLR